MSHILVFIRTYIAMCIYIYIHTYVYIHTVCVYIHTVYAIFCTNLCTVVPPTVQNVLLTSVRDQDKITDYNISWKVSI